MFMASCFSFDAFRNSFPVDIGETNVVITISALESKRLSRRRVNVICHRIVPERGKAQKGSYQTPTFVRVLSVNSSQLRLTGPKILRNHRTNIGPNWQGLVVPG